jgi:hypothetical protein
LEVVHDNVLDCPESTDVGEAEMLAVGTGELVAVLVDVDGLFAPVDVLFVAETATVVDTKVVPIELVAAR